MKIAVVRETHDFESRVAVSPEVVGKMVEAGISVCIEKGAGLGSSFLDQAYEKAGADLAKDFKSTVSGAQLLLKVQAPSSKEIKDLPKGIAVLGTLGVLSNPEQVKAYAKAGVDALSMDLVPRITRAQSMDVLSSQSNLAGYRSVIDGAAAFGRAFPMMMTAAGTIPPAKVLVLGAGVAGLQAVATAKRLGAVVSAFDVRPAVKEQVESLGATFIEVEAPKQDAETSGGYAKEMDEDYKRRQGEKVHEVLKKTDIAITTALIPGRPAPTLITKAMVKDMKAGSVIVDLAAPAGGNCEEAKPGETNVTNNGVSVLAPLNIASAIAYDASQLYARNLWSFVQLLLNEDKSQLQLDSEDEIIKAALLTRQGRIVQEKFAA
ncbi:MAG: Re/Si-specific NAD(P)(+) transhydrogenase subunit alpha [bacterium]|nr:Re/Si-specific NAD(P)(+) transhydrogenase subunit alpha [bacterium]